MWAQVTWMVARAAGFTAYGLLAGSVILGLALSLHWQGARWPRMVTNALHNHVTLVGLVFLIVHVVAVWIDPFTAFSALAIFVPFVTAYRTVWMSLGIVALYLGIAIGISTLLRPRIGYAAWRTLHTLTLGIFVLATLHGIYTGTDTHALWAIGLYGLSAVVVTVLFALRLARSAAEARRRTQKRAAAAAMHPHVAAR